MYVFYIHFRVFSTFSEAEGYLAFFLDVALSLTHVAVPLFFAISGALFYRNYSLNQTLKKWKSRFFSLCVPYMVWNTTWLVLALLGNYTPLGAFLGGVKTELSFEAVISGIFLHRFFEPFWFILQLITLTVSCPIIYLLIKNKYIGLTVIGICILLNWLGLGEGGILIENPDMVIVYLIGAWIGKHHFEWITVRRSKNASKVGFVVYFACCAFNGTDHLLPQWVPVSQISLAVTILSIIAFWVSFDCFAMKSCPDYLKDSFLIYAMHSFVGAALAKIVRMLLPIGDACTLITALITFVGTIVIICVVGRLLSRFAPKLKRVLVGR